MITTVQMDFNEFKVSHSTQLNNIPERYWDALFEKFSHEVGSNQSRIAYETYQKNCTKRNTMPEIISL